MIRNYLRVAWRNLKKNKLFSVIYILGLSLGLACCLLILLYTKDELSFDRFQRKKDLLFRVTCEVVDKKNARDSRYGEAAAVQGPAFKNGIPEVEDFVRTFGEDLYFGTTNAVGKTLELEINNKFETFVVFGMAKRSPENSSIKFDMLLPFRYYAAMSKNDHGNWHLLNYSTYLVLHPQASPVNLGMKRGIKFLPGATIAIIEPLH